MQVSLTKDEENFVEAKQVFVLYCCRSSSSREVCYRVSRAFTTNLPQLSSYFVSKPFCMQSSTSCIAAAAAAAAAAATAVAVQGFATYVS